MAQALFVLFNLRTDGSTRELGRSMTEDLQRGLVKRWEATLVQISTDHCLYAL